MTDEAVVFRQVWRGFGAVHALSGVNLSMRRGEMVALLGANGAGKSTAIALMLGLLRPTSGQVSILGGPPAEAVAAGRIGAMLQEGGLMPGVSVSRMLDLVRGMYSSPRALRQLVVDADLDDVMDRRVDRLSGGQAQRLRFAVAIAGNPSVLVLDEPTAAMDVQSRRSFWATINTYAAGGRTVLFATHYMQEADDNADRIVVLTGGRIVADGTPAQVRAAAGGAVVTFDVGGLSTVGLELLPAVTSKQIRGDRVELRTADTEATLRGLLSVREHIPGLQVSGERIEDAVLALTATEMATTGSGARS